MMSLLGAINGAKKHSKTSHRNQKRVGMAPKCFFHIKGLHIIEPNAADIRSDCEPRNRKGEDQPEREIERKKGCYFDLESDDGVSHGVNEVVENKVQSLFTLSHRSSKSRYIIPMQHSTNYIMDIMRESIDGVCRSRAGRCY
jgi:hypothetical protein